MVIGLYRSCLLVSDCTSCLGDGQRIVAIEDNEMRDEIPVTCTLSNAELREREATLLAQFKLVVTAAQEIDEGYLFHLPGHKECLALAARILSAERECCPFLKFELTAEPNQGPLTLRVTGPVGVKEFIKTLLS